MKKIDEITMRNMGIFDLRSLARDIGVHSPTIYKKEELISKIMQIMSGEKTPQMPKSRQGRPPKERNNFIVNQDNGLLTLSNTFYNNENIQRLDNLEYDFSSPRSNSLSTLLDSLPQTAFEYDDSGEFENGEGYYLKIENEGYIFVNGKSADLYTAILVPNELVACSNIRQGDFLKCIYRNSKSLNLRIATQIKNLDEFISEKEKFTNLRLIQTSNFFSPTDKLNFKIREGSKVILKINSLTDYQGILNDSMKFSKDNKCTFVNLCLDAIPEYNLNFEESFYTEIGDTDKMNLFIVELVINRLMRLIENGKRVVILINELMKLLKYQNFINGNSIDDFKSNSIILIEKLLKIAGLYSNGGSLTILALYKNDNISNCGRFLLNELENYNCQFVDIN